LTVEPVDHETYGFGIGVGEIVFGDAGVVGWKDELLEEERLETEEVAVDEEFFALDTDVEGDDLGAEFPVEAVRLLSEWKLRGCDG